MTRPRPRWPRAVLTAAGFLSVPLLLLLGYVAAFKLSYTRDQYVCRWCGASAESQALRAFGKPILRTPLGQPTPTYHTRLYQRAVASPCGHSWEWNCANSSGICFNSSADWDGPLGNYGIEDLEPADDKALLEALALLADDGERKRALDRLRTLANEDPREYWKVIRQLGKGPLTGEAAERLLSSPHAAPGELTVERPGELR